MVFLFRDYELRFRASFVWELSKIYGIGYKSAFDIVNWLGISVNTAVSYINYYKFEFVSYIIKVYYVTGDRLKSFLKQRLNDFIAMRLLRGIRFSKGLPVRGQRTHTNGRQNKYYKNV